MLVDRLVRRAQLMDGAHAMAEQRSSWRS